MSMETIKMNFAEVAMTSLDCLLWIVAATARDAAFPAVRMYYREAYASRSPARVAEVIFVRSVATASSSFCMASR